MWFRGCMEHKPPPQKAKFSAEEQQCSQIWLINMWVLSWAKWQIMDPAPRLCSAWCRIPWFVCLAGCFMVMKSWQWEESKSLTRFLSYSLQMAWKEGLVSSWYLPNNSEMISWGGWVYSQVSGCVEMCSSPTLPPRQVGYVWKLQHEPGTQAQSYLME